MTNAVISEQVFEGFVQAARQACREIEHIDLHNTQVLLSALIQLLREANCLTECSIEADDCESEGGSLLPDALTRIPEDLVFHVVFDPLNPESVCASSLKDALSDIYKSLKFGMNVLDKEPQKKLAIFWEWRFDYEFHWGRHLIDVIRFLVLSKNTEVPASAD